MRNGWKLIFILLSVSFGQLHAQTSADRLDIDKDGTVGFGDFLAFADAFGSDNATFDADESGTVDFADFIVFAEVFGETTHYLPIEFADETFAQAVRLALGREEGGVTADEAAALEDLRIHAPGERIDLSDLKHTPRLATLSIRALPRDISALGSLDSLRSLNLSGVGVDLSPIGSLAGLKRFSLKSHRVVSLDFLEGLTQLDSLVLGAGTIGITDLSALHGLSKLETLEVRPAFNVFQDLSFIRNMAELRSLKVTGVRADDFGFLADLEKLERLEISRYSHRIPGPVIRLGPNLREVKLSDVNVAGRLDFLGNVEQLEVLRITFGDCVDCPRIETLSGLARHPTLKELDLPRNRIADLSGLAGLDSLERLDLRDNPFTDLAPLSGLTNLRSLRLGGSPIDNIAPLASLSNLQSLEINATDQIFPLIPDDELILMIESLSGLSGLQSLTYLNLNTPAVTDISPLATLTGLTSATIRVGSANLTQLSGLGALERLTVSAGDTLWSSESVSLPAMTTLKIQGRMRSIADLIDLPNLKFLTIEDLGLTRIAGIGASKSLQRIKAAGNLIESVDILSDLPNLEEVDISNNTVADLSPLIGHPTLQSLRVAANPLSSDARTNQIPRLQMQGVDVRDRITPFEFEQLNPLLGQAVSREVGGTRGSTLYVTELFLLESLDISGQDIRSLEGLQYAVNLSSLTLDRVPELADLTQILKFPQLTHLSVDGLQVVNGFDPLGKLRYITELSMRDIGLSDISLISEDRTLLSLTLGGEALTDISSLVSLPDLQSLSIHGSPGIGDLTLLRSLPELTTVNLIDVPVDGLQEIAGPTNLTTLRVENAGLIDISLLSQWPDLDTLSLAGNDIVDLSEIPNLTNLRWLDLRDNHIVDITPLLDLSASMRLVGLIILDGNPLDPIEAPKVIRTLRSNRRQVGVLARGVTPEGGDL